MGGQIDNWVEGCGECLVVLFQGRVFCVSRSDLESHGEGGCSCLCHGRAADGSGSNGSCQGLREGDLRVVLVRGVSTALASVASLVPWIKVYPS